MKLKLIRDPMHYLRTFRLSFDKNCEIVLIKIVKSH